MKTSTFLLPGLSPLLLTTAGARRAAFGKTPSFLLAAVCACALFAPNDTRGNQTNDMLDFNNAKNGNARVPVGNVYAAPDTYVYGVTTSGGAYGNGVIYKFKPGPVAFSTIVLHNFGGNIQTPAQYFSSGQEISPAMVVPDGTGPTGGLVQDSQGFLWGTTTSGGAGYGVIFRISTNGDGTVAGGQNGSYQIMHVFYANTGTALTCDGGVAVDGQNPQGPLTVSADGNTLYGTTFNGGSFPDPYSPSEFNGPVQLPQTFTGHGTVFSIAHDGTCYQILHVFEGFEINTVLEDQLYSFLDDANPVVPPDGAGPQGNLVLYGNWLYGTTAFDGWNPLSDPEDLESLLLANPPSITEQCLPSMLEGMVMGIARFGRLPAVRNMRRPGLRFWAVRMEVRRRD